MKKSFGKLMMATLAMAAVCGAASAAVIASWNNGDLNPASDMTINAAVGTGTISRNGVAWASLSNAYSSNTWEAGASSVPTASVRIAVSTVGFENPVLTTSIRRTTTGPVDFDVYYSTTGPAGAYTFHSTINLPSSGSFLGPFSVDLSSVAAADNNADLVFDMRGFNASAPGGTGAFQTISVDGDGIAGADPIVGGVTPDASADTVTIHFDKEMTGAGTFTAQPDNVVASSAVPSGDDLVLTFPSPLSGYPTVSTIDIVGATSTDSGSLTGATGSFVAGVTSLADLRSSVEETDGLSSLGTNTTIRTSGIVTENYIDNFAQISVTLSDDDGGVSVRKVLGGPNEQGFGLANPIGSELSVVGNLANFNGILQVAERAGLPFVSIESSGNTLPDFTTINLPPTFANLEEYENMLVRLQNVTWVVGAAPGDIAPMSDGPDWVTEASGSGQTYSVTTHTTGNMPPADTIIQLRVDRDVRNGDEGSPTAAPVPDPLTGTTIPVGRFDVTGLLGQFDSSNPHTEGYQIVVLGAASFETATQPASTGSAWSMYE